MTCLTKVPKFSATVRQNRYDLVRLLKTGMLSKFSKILNSRELSKIFDPEFNQRPSENFTFTPGIRILSLSEFLLGYEIFEPIFLGNYYHVTFLGLGKVGPTSQNFFLRKVQRVAS